MSEWRVQVTGEQRKDVDTALLVQAILALGKQLDHERREREAREAQSAGFSEPDQPAGPEDDAC